jgi:hypothetical protein
MACVVSRFGVQSQVAFGPPTGSPESGRPLITNVVTAHQTGESRVFLAKNSLS